MSVFCFDAGYPRYYTIRKTILQPAVQKENALPG